MTTPYLSFVMPCLNEARTLQACIEEIHGVMKNALPEVAYEIVIADNGSSDGSQQIAKDAGAIVVDVEEKGYGSALSGGIAAAKGTYVIMADSDLSYDFSVSPNILRKLEEGYALVMGNRFKGKIHKGAMPFLHKYLGNPVLSQIGKTFFKLKTNDFHCGIRGFNRQRLLELKLQTTGMEYASEMVVRAGLENYKITEVPAILRKDGRDRRPHLRTWRDGWRHLKFLLLYCPTWMFTIPGGILFFFGLLLLLLTLPGPLNLGVITLDVHTMVYASAMMITGFQAFGIGRIAQSFAEAHGLRPATKKKSNPNQVELGALTGVLALLLGLASAVFSVTQWAQNSFGDIHGNQLLRIAIPSGLLISFGLECIFLSFALGLTKLKTRH